MTDRLLPQLIHQSLLQTSVAESLKAMAARVGGGAFLRQQLAMLGRQDSRPLLVTIAVPTLVAVGDGDPLTPPMYAEEIHAGIAGSTLHRFVDCGHLPALERPSETTAVLKEWLGW